MERDKTKLSIIRKSKPYKFNKFSKEKKKINLKKVYKYFGELKIINNKTAKKKTKKIIGKN